MGHWSSCQVNRFTGTVLGIGFLMATSTGYPTGAPQVACNLLTPSHGTPQRSPSPYTIEPDTSVYKPGESVRVRITGGVFEGLMLQARRRSGEIVGTWSSPPKNTRIQTCWLRDDTMTHSNTNSKDNPDFTWTAPDDETNRPIYFIATVARSKYIWWTRIESANLDLSTTTTTTTIKTTSTTKTTTTTPKAATTAAIAIPRTPSGIAPNSTPVIKHPVQTVGITETVDRNTTEVTSSTRCTSVNLLWQLVLLVLSAAVTYTILL